MSSLTCGSCRQQTDLVQVISTISNQTNHFELVRSFQKTGPALIGNTCLSKKAPKTTNQRQKLHHARRSCRLLLLHESPLPWHQTHLDSKFTKDQKKCICSIIDAAVFIFAWAPTVVAPPPVLTCLRHRDFAEAAAALDL